MVVVRCIVIACVMCVLTCTAYAQSRVESAVLSTVSMSFNANIAATMRQLFALNTCHVPKRVAVGPNIYSPPQVSNCSSVNAVCEHYCLTSSTNRTVHCSNHNVRATLCKPNMPTVSGACLH